MLITLEGIDGSGKTTLAGCLARRLEAKGLQTLVTKELTTPIGRVLKEQYLSGRATATLKALLFAADRIERQECAVVPALDKGLIVIADRWTESALAYRSAECGEDERAAIRSYTEHVNARCLRPSLGLYIDVPASIGLGRRASPAEYSEVFLESVRREYRRLVAEGRLREIDGNRPIESVTNEALGLALQILG